MFSLTKNAAQQVQKAAKQGGMENLPLRLAAREKKDGSIDYQMGFDEAKENDLHIQLHGVDIVIEPRYAELLDECVLDFVQMEDGQWQFIFLNPKDPHFVPPKE